MSQLDWSAVCLDRLSREPLGDQLAAAIEARVATGLLARGARLPTTRELAGVLGINRGAVQSAYSKLARQGLLASRVGSGTIVRVPLLLQWISIRRLFSRVGRFKWPLR